MVEFLLELIGCIYDAALDQSLWPVTLTKIANLFGGGGGTIGIYDLASQSIVEYASAGLPEDGVQQYVGRLFGDDPRLTWSLAHPAVATFYDHLHITEQEMDHAAFYAWLSRQGFRYSIAHQRYEGGVRACLALQRTPGQGHVEKAEIELFERVAPHVVRSSLMARRLGGLDLARAGAGDALERLSLGVVFIDAQGRPLLVNRMARKIAASGDGLSISRDGATASRTEDDARLQRAIGDTVNTSHGRGTGLDDLVSLGRPSGKRPLAVRVSPLSRNAPTFAEQRPAAVLFVSDPEVVPLPPRELLKRAYKLTPRECDVSLALAGGQTLEQAAQAHGLARATVRVHLRSMLRKTDTHSQSALVRLLMATVPGLE